MMAAIASFVSWVSVKSVEDIAETYDACSTVPAPAPAHFIQWVVSPPLRVFELVPASSDMLYVHLEPDATAEASQKPILPLMPSV